MLKQLTIIGLVLIIGICTSAFSQSTVRNATLDSLSRSFAQELDHRRPQLYYDLLASDKLADRQLNEDPSIQLMYIDQRGRPVYFATMNLNAARTVSTDDVWPGGSGGFSLDGSGTALGELGVWDGGGVLTSHQEFGGRVTQQDSPGSTHYHSTHVAGTMVASGVDPSAKGMSFAALLAAYDWDSDDSEMASAAATMNVSSHSYGYVAGWYYSGSDWYWYGDITISATEDYGFGFYASVSHDWDDIAYNAPFYTIVKSAGNDRNDAGPGAGGGHYVWDDGWVWSTNTRDPDGGSNGFDCISWRGTAKNIITVGAIEDIPGGWTGSGDVVMSSFSGWGPTDDGRIKPDIVANGISLYSCMDGDNSDYDALSGTSMSTPNVSGSLNLLVRYYEDTHGASTPLSATMKALIIQTADEAGSNPGPDFKFGWGLMNTLKAAELIQADSLQPERIIEGILTNGNTDQYNVVSDGVDPFRVTIVWTDPPGTPPSPSLNPTTSMLTNDLDLRVEHVASSTVYQPYVLDPANPDNAATTGDNIRDNVEQVYVSAPAAGDYVVTVSHKGVLLSPQVYSIIKPPGEETCIDSDGDGYGDPGHPENDCPDDNCPDDYNPGQEDVDQDSFGAACDCNDNDENINPNTVWYQDSDSDTYGNPVVTLTQCEQPSGYVLDDTDCDDADENINPTTVWYEDSDSDTYGNPAVTLTQCEQPTGYVLDDTDCDDSDENINPNTVWYEDSDSDTYGNPVVTLTQCEQPSGYVLDNTDCDDSDENINPTTVWYEDSDSDTYGNPAVTLTQCEQPTGYVLDYTDCDDADENINPTTVWYEDSDGDTYGNSAVSLTQCEQPTGYVL
ncbi:MAG: hypothetical protein DRP45_09575, partial [Candidatus Zixiibacteriota bacterium]